MDRFAVFVDAGYLLAAAGEACCGTRARSEIQCDYEVLVPALETWTAEHCGLPILRTYWYDGAREALPTLDQLRVGALPNVKLRLGRLTGGRQKGVDSLIIRDLMTLARERAIATSFLVSGDEDLREGVLEAQDVGVRVILLGVPTQGVNQAATLIREADEHVILPVDYWQPYFTLVARAPETMPLALAPSIDDAKIAGSAFALQWTAQASSAMLGELMLQDPRIPVELDAELMVNAERTLGSIRERQDLKRAVRAGFWDATRTASAPPSGPVGGEPG